MSEVHVVISSDERDLLVRMLETAINEKRVVVHRTEFSRDFRHEIEAEEAQMEGLLGRLSQTVANG